MNILNNIFQQYFWKANNRENILEPIFGNNNIVADISGVDLCVQHNRENSFIDVRDERALN